MPKLDDVQSMLNRYHSHTRLIGAHDEQIAQCTTVIKNRENIVAELERQKTESIDALSTLNSEFAQMGVEVDA